MIDYKAIGRRIAFYRKKAVMTQSVLSEKLGVTESYISQIEHCSTKVSLSRLEQTPNATAFTLIFALSRPFAFSATAYW